MKLPSTPTNRPAPAWLGGFKLEARHGDVQVTGVRQIL